MDSIAILGYWSECACPDVKKIVSVDACCSLINDSIPAIMSEEEQTYAIPVRSCSTAADLCTSSCILRSSALSVKFFCKSNQTKPKKRTTVTKGALLLSDTGCSLPLDLPMFALYQRRLRTHPKVTNALMTGFLFGAGDAIAQIFFPDPHTKNKFVYDPARTLRGVFYGSCVFSFIGDKWYKVLARIHVPGRSGYAFIDKAKDAVARTAVDQLIWAPVGIPLYYFVMSLLERRPLAETKRKLEENWWPTLRANWMVWPAFQVVNLGFVPVQHQLLSVNVLSIAWNTYLSLRNNQKSENNIVHFPPVPE